VTVYDHTYDKFISVIMGL